MYQNLSQQLLILLEFSYPIQNFLFKTATVNIKISWTNYGDAAFMIHFYDMKESDNMIKVETVEDTNLVEYELTGLSSNSQYSAIVYALNQYGISRGSNILIIDT